MTFLKISSCLFLFADDTTLSFAHSDINLLLDTLTDDLELIFAWLKYNRLIIYWSKTNAILFNFKSKSSFNRLSFDLSFDSNPIVFVDSVKLLGVIIDNKLKFDHHIPVSK